MELSMSVLDFPETEAPSAANESHITFPVALWEISYAFVAYEQKHLQVMGLS